jgi:hypothetical protein
MFDNKKTVSVIFNGNIPGHLIRRSTTIVAPKSLQQRIEYMGALFVDLDTLIDSGSVYEAATMLEQLPKLTFADGSYINKAINYHGYELWWVHYNSFFYNFCLPYTKYKRLLEYLKDFSGVEIYHSPHQALFNCYLLAYQVPVQFYSPWHPPAWLPSFGVFVQALFAVFSLPLLILQRKPVLVFTSDKFDKAKDYDFRMGFVYEELRHRRIPFVEFVRSLESGAGVFRHALHRCRPVIYSDGVMWLAKFCSALLGGYGRAQQRFGTHRLPSNTTPENRFLSLIAIQYLAGVYSDIWAIRIMAWVVKVVGIKVALLTATTERNFHAVLGCKIQQIPTIGILHGVASRYSTPYDYLTGFTGDKKLSVDKYGVWSEWWREHYLVESNAYTPQQLYVSGPMRPITVSVSQVSQTDKSKTIPVLFVAEQTASPHEVMPYLRAVLAERGFAVTLKFRPFRDGFEQWLLAYEPEILTHPRIKVIRGTMQDAITQAEVVVGCHSTGVLEALLQNKVPIFIYTDKWGDYYSMSQEEDKKHFLAKSPTELLTKIQESCKVSQALLQKLRQQYFGDPATNGSVWLVEQAAQFL